MNIKCFKANRGEGKTRWLFEKAATAHKDGKQLYYIGNPNTMCGLKNTWESIMHTKCPIVNARDVYTIGPNSCCLTDELFLNIKSVGFFYDVIQEVNNVDWFITVSSEVF